SDSISSRGKASSVHLISCRQTMSGSHSFSQARRCSIRCLIELTFQVAMRMRKIRPLDGTKRGTKVHLSPAGRGRIALAMRSIVLGDPSEGPRLPRGTVTPHPICCANRSLPVGEVDQACGSSRRYSDL